MFLYSDGTEVMVGDSVFIEKGSTPGVVELVVTSYEQMKEIGVDERGSCSRLPRLGLIYLPQWSLEEDPLILISRAVQA